MPDTATIDSLAIEIGASSNDAVQAIDKLAESLGRLKQAVRGGTPNLSKWSAEIKKVADAAKEMESSATSLSKVAEAFEKLSNLKRISIPTKLGENLRNIGLAVESVKPKSIENLDRMTAALQRLENVRFQTLLAISMIQMPNIPTDIGLGIRSLSKALNELTPESLDRIREFAEIAGRMSGVDFSGLSEFSEQTSKPTKATLGDGLASYIQNIRFATEASGKFAQAMEAVKNAVAIGLGNALDIVVFALKKLASIALSVAKAVGGVLLNALKKLASALKSVASAAWNLTKNITSNFFKQLISPVTSLTNRINKLASSMGRILFYRVIRTVIKELGEAIKEGTENAYWFSKNLGDATHYISEAYDAFASASAMMKNQVGAAWATLFANIQPYINQIIAVVARAAEVVTQFFAILGGKSTYLKAINYSKEWAESTDKGAKAAKEWRNQLMGFDELNRLEAPTDSNRSGNSSDIPDYGAMFEETPVEGWLAGLLASLKSGKWAEIGKALGDKFNSIIENFKWRDWGRKIGEKIQNAIDFAYSFLQTKGFRNLGAGIVDFLDSAFSEINFSTLGRLYVRIRTVLWDVLVGAVEALGRNGAARRLAEKLSDFITGALRELADWIRGINADEVATAIKDFFAGIKGEEIKSAFVDLIKTAWSKAIELKNAIWDEETKNKVTGALKEFFANLKWEDIRNAIATAWSTMMNVIDDIWPPADREKFAADFKSTLNELLGKAIDAIDVSGLWDHFKKKVKKELFGIGEYTVEGFEGGVKATFDDGYTVTRTLTPFGRFVEAVKDLFKTHSPSEVFYEIGENVGLGFEQGLLDWWSKGTEWFTTPFENLLSSINSIIGGSDESSVFNSLGMSMTSGLANGIREGWNGVTDFFTSAIPQLVAKVTAGIQSISDKIQGFKARFTEAGRSIITGISDGFSDKWDGFSSNVSQKVTALVNLIKQRVTDVISNMKERMNSAAESIRATWESLRVGTQNAISQAASAVSSFLSRARSALRISGYASGGFPQEGELFIARESGPEMVGSIGNKSAVANNDQIVAAISAGVFEAVSSALGSLRESGSEDNAINVYIGNELVYSGYSKWSRRQQLIAGGRA